MKNYLQLTLAVAVSMALTGCLKDVESNNDIETAQAADDAVQAESEANPYAEMHDVVLPVEETAAVETMPNDSTIDYGDVGDGQNIDYGKILDTEKGMAALEQGRKAVMSAAGAVDQQQLAAVASQLKERAANAAVAFKTPVSGSAAGTGIDSVGSDWNRLEVSSVRVIDGDTVEVLQEGKQSERVRFAGIDAPESTQLFGKQSTQTLENCVAGKPVTVVYKKRDPYERLVGVVYAGGVDCNYEQVKAGSAWHYKQYQKDQPAGFPALYADAETKARNSKIGLWAAEAPQKPWEYRREKK